MSRRRTSSSSLPKSGYRQYLERCEFGVRRARARGLSDLSGIRPALASRVQPG